MTSFQLFEAIGIIDDTLIAEVNNSSYKKQRKVWRKIESSVRKSMAKTIWHGRLPGGA